MSFEPEKGALVLVADDSLVIRSLLRRQLEEQGHLVIEAVDGEDALERCRENRPDVVLLDVEMPRLNGHETLVRMREEAELASIPVVFLTARASTEDVVEGLRLGAHDYLRKPFESAELLARVSAAVRVKRLQDELRERNIQLDEISRMDPLTRLPNRRHLQTVLYSETVAAHRSKHPLGLLMVDVDHFKSVNDTFGHQEGDAVLRAVAVRVADACGNDYIVGRWGGEEFLVVAPRTDRDSATKLGELIRQGVSSHAIPVEGTVSLSITVSVGVASGIDHIDPLLRAADHALYEAKNSGRNRVVTSTAI